MAPSRKQRTFGWIQDGGKLSNLRKLVLCLSKGTKEQKWLINERFPLLLHNNLMSQEDCNKFTAELNKGVYEYTSLIGKGGDRKAALCTGIAQAIFDAQSDMELEDITGEKITIKKPYQSDWSSGAFVKWAVTVGFLDYDSDKDTCVISKIATQLENQTETGTAIQETLLSYPPVIRILTLLEEGEALTKFELGSQLGFIGEKGFSSINQDEFLATYLSEEDKNEKAKIRSNMEGSSDKYARMIGSWLKDLGWVNTERKKVTETFLGKTYSCELQAYKITIKGLKALKRSRSHSSKSGISKRVPFEMLATKVSSPDYFRKRRALIIEALQSGDKDVNQLLRRLNSENIKANESTVIDDINGLIHIGLSVDRKNNGEYHLVDTVVGLKIPQDISTIPDSAVELKNTISENLKYLNHKYLILVDLAFSDSANKAKKNSDARDFEYQTADLFTKELSYNGMRLGDSLKPDVIISYGNEGVIVDNKSYAKGFNAGVNNTDEMGRYIEDNSNRTPGTPPNEWWKNFNYDVSTFHFLFVSSYITGKLENLKILSKRNNDITGGAIGVESLLYLADKVKGKVLSEKDLFPMMNNGEIVVKPIVEDYKKELLVAEEKVQ